MLRRPVCEHGLIEQEGASATAHRKTDRALSRGSYSRAPFSFAQLSIRINEAIHQFHLCIYLKTRSVSIS